MAINPANRQAERARLEALQFRQSAILERAMRKALAGQYRAAIAAYEQRGESGIREAIAGASSGLVTALSSAYRSSAVTLGRDVLMSAKSAHGGLVIKTTVDEMLAQLALEFAQEWTATKVVQITTTTEDWIRATIQRGLLDGLSVQSIAQKLRDDSIPISAIRAHVIARTETHAAANFGAQTGAELTGLDMRREWVSAMDDRTRDGRFNHRTADGQTRGMKEPFVVGGEKLMYPGDFSGSAGNTIMCRCQVVFVYD